MDLTNLGVQDITLIGGVVVSVAYSYYQSKQNKDDIKGLKNQCNCGVLANEIKHLKEDISELKSRK